MEKIEFKIKDLEPLRLQLLIIYLLLIIHTIYQFVETHSEIVNEDSNKAVNVAFLLIILWFFEKNYLIILELFRKHNKEMSNNFNKFLTIILVAIITLTVLMLAALVLKSDTSDDDYFLISDWLTVSVLVILCWFSEDKLEKLVTVTRIMNTYGLLIMVCYVILRFGETVKHGWGDSSKRFIIDFITLFVRTYMFFTTANKKWVKKTFDTKWLLYLLILAHLYNFGVDLYFAIVDFNNLVEVIDALLELILYLVYGLLFAFVYINKETLKYEKDQTIDIASEENENQ